MFSFRPSEMSRREANSLRSSFADAPSGMRIPMPSAISRKPGSQTTSVFATSTAL